MSSSADSTGAAAEQRAAENLGPGTPTGSGDDRHPRIVVAPGPQGAAGPWQYLCEGCGEQALSEGRDDAQALAQRHRSDAHGGTGSIDVTPIGAV